MRKTSILTGDAGNDTMILDEGGSFPASLPKIQNLW